ncbi:MAG: MarR family transcriptional regulator [Rhodopirellula sp.]|nr:MarR family transcriptional regulator [Rhodopirellula sp.]
MNFIPSPIQVLFLWRLLASDGSEFWKRMKPPITAQQRKALEAAGLIAVEKRKESDRKGATPAMYLSLTEAGWDWAANHLDAEISKKSPAASFVLQDMLGKLKDHLATTGISLADFICPPSRNQDVASPDTPQRVREGYSQASGGRWNVRVRLVDLRAVLADVPRDRLDAALLALERDGGLVLYPLDDPREIRPEDEAAAVVNTLGIRRHIVCIER